MAHTCKTRSDADELVEMLLRGAHTAWDSGYRRLAFRLFKLIASETGDEVAQNTTGYLYDHGIGVARDSSKAVLWYQRAYRRGYLPAAINLGLVLRERGQRSAAVRWFRRALAGGEREAAMNLAQVYFSAGEWARAEGFLKVILRAKHVTESTREDAAAMLRSIRVKRGTMRRTPRLPAVRTKR